MQSYHLKGVEFNLDYNYIQVGRNWGNRIYFDDINIARAIYKAIRDEKIIVNTYTLGSFKTINDIKDFIEQIKEN